MSLQPTRTSGGRTQLTVHESRTPIAHAAAHDESLWFFPFGRPEPGERTIAFEILPAGSTPVPEPGRMPRTQLGDYTTLRIVARPAARVPIRMTADSVGTIAAFDGDLWVHRPVILAVRGRQGRRGINIVLQPEPWAEEGRPDLGPCIRWTWLDGDPPSGGLCLGGRPEAWQMIYGSGGVTLRIERVP